MADSQCGEQARLGDAIRLAATASYLPARWLPAAHIAHRAGLPETVVIERFGLLGKHVAAAGEHVNELAATAGSQLLTETGTDPASLDAVVYFGSIHKDYRVWQAAPRIAHLLGAGSAFALELDYVSCGAPVAARLCHALMKADPALRRVLAVGTSRESELVDYHSPRVRFAYDFGDGAVAALFTRGGPGSTVLGSHALTDGSLSLQVKVTAGGSVHPDAPGPARLDVTDPAAVKARLDAVSLPNFLAVAEEALHRSGANLADLAYGCPNHLKRSMHLELIKRLGLTEEQSCYLSDTGHLSGVDPLLGLDRAGRAGLLQPGDLVLLLAAGTGYTWAATVLRWGQTR